MPDISQLLIILAGITLIGGPQIALVYMLITKGRTRGLAPYFAAWFMTWPVFAYMGAQGFTGAVGFLAIPALLFVRPKSLPKYTLAGFTFLIWILIASFWSPGGKPFMEGSFGAGTFTMDMVGPRFALTILACIGVILAVRHIAPDQTERSAKTVRITAFIVGIIVTVTSVFMQEILTFIESSGGSKRNDMTQNMLRNANTFMLLLPFLLAWMWDRIEGARGKVLCAAVFAASIYAFAMTGTQSAMLGAIFILAGMAVVYLSPRNGFKVIFTAIGAYIVAAPLLFKAGTSFVAATGLPMPASFFSRVKGWEAVGEKIMEKPLFGHGLEATYNWGETFSSRPEWLADAVARYGPNQGWAQYEIINNHPHNMALQIWVETGLIGAVLAAIAVVFLGWRLKAPSTWPPVAKYAAAGLVGAVLSIFSFGYSFWNEAFWATVTMAAAAILLQARRDHHAATDIEVA